MTQDEIIEMARQALEKQPIENWNSYPWVFADETLQAFAKLVEQNVRNTINDEAKKHLEELRKNFDAENAKLRLHQWASHGGLWIEDLWKHQDKNT